MNELQQLNIFELTESSTAIEQTEPTGESILPLEKPGAVLHIQNTDNKELVIPVIGDEAKIKLPADVESEEYQYLKYYYKHLFNEIGKVTNVTLYPSGKYTCEVTFSNNILLLHPENLIIRY